MGGCREVLVMGGCREVLVMGGCRLKECGVHDCSNLMEHTKITTIDVCNNL